MDEQSNPDPTPASEAPTAATPTPDSPSSASTQEQIKAFFKNDLVRMVKLFLGQPISGTQSLFTDRSPNAHVQALVLIVTTGLLYMFIPYVFAGPFRRMMNLEFMLKVGLVPIIFMMFLTAISFGIKSFSGKADFKSELFTGALNAFPLTIILLSFAVASMFGDAKSAMKNPLDAGVIFMVVQLYAFLMMINILQQSLKTSGTKDVVTWYVSPIALLAACWATVKITQTVLS